MECFRNILNSLLIVQLEEKKTHNFKLKLFTIRLFKGNLHSFYKFQKVTVHVNYIISLKWGYIYV